MLEKFHMHLENVPDAYFALIAYNGDVIDLDDYKLPLHSKGYAEIWKDNWTSEYGLNG